MSETIWYRCRLLMWAARCLVLDIYINFFVCVVRGVVYLFSLMRKNRMNTKNSPLPFEPTSFFVELPHFVPFGLRDHRHTHNLMIMTYLYQYNSRRRLYSSCHGLATRPLTQRQNGRYWRGVVVPRGSLTRNGETLFLYIYILFFFFIISLPCCCCC